MSVVSPRPDDRPSLSVAGLTLSRGAERILRGVDLTVAPGQICALMGASGAGKSTVLRCVVALQAFDAGQVRVGDLTLSPGPVPPQSRLHALRRCVGMVFQAHALFEHLTVIENVTLAPMLALGWTRERATAVAHGLLTSLGVDHRSGAYPRQLSGGEAQRVAIARALAPDPGVLLMDEPTSALDPSRREALGLSLRELARGGRGLLIATHDDDFARAFAHTVITIDEGRIARSGTAREVLGDG